MIKYIIFDFGGVILKHKSTLMEDKISEIFSIPTEQALKIWREVKPNALVGKISSEQFLARFKDELRSDKTLPEILKEWRDIYVREAKKVDWELLQLIEKLRNNYQVFLFTDTIDTHDEYNSTRGIYDKFTRVFKSHKEGLSKLNDDAFTNVLNKISAQTDECIFIDDLEVNVKRAEALGMRGILYKDRKELTRELVKLGIKVD